MNVLVALLAGVAGMVALMAGEGSGVLVGVFISVTTVPAAGFAAVAAVLGAWPQALGSLVQLGINLVGIVVAALVVLLIAGRRGTGRGGSSSAPEAAPAVIAGNRNVAVRTRSCIDSDSVTFRLPASSRRADR